MNRTIYLAVGCFWGGQKFFDQIYGVVSTEVGYANAPSDNPTYEQVKRQSSHAETIKVTYQSDKVSLWKLLDYFYWVIDPFGVNKQRPDQGVQYRSGIYFTNEEDKKIIMSSLRELEQKLGSPVAIQVAPLKNYYPAEEYHQKYLEKNPNGYCHIDLNNLKEHPA